MTDSQGSDAFGVESSPEQKRLWRGIDRAVSFERNHFHRADIAPMCHDVENVTDVNQERDSQS